MTDMKLAHVPLDQLRVSDANARKVAPDPDKLRELAASIAAHGLLEPLIASAGTDGTTVIGGGRRLAALQQLAAAGKWDPGRPVGCVLISNGAAPGTTAEARRHLEVSLAENTGREDLHPVDQAEAFRVLRDRQGATDKQLAARFGVSGRTVQRRLRMAQAAPELRKKCRDGELPLGVLEAVCIEPDHRRQAEAVEAAKHYHDPPSAVTSYLKKEAVPANSSLGRFVGLERYEAAGGAVSQDLFADGDAAAHYFDDKPLVQRLALERLKEAAEQESAVNGWPAKQVKCAEEVPWNYYDHWQSRSATKFSSLPSAARAGAVLHLGMGHNGEIERLALVQKGPPAQAAQSSPIGEDAAPPAQTIPLSDSLRADLREMRRSLSRAALAQADPDVAAGLLTYALAQQIYAGRYENSGLALHIDPPRQPLPAHLRSACASEANRCLEEIEKPLLGWLARKDPLDRWIGFKKLIAPEREQLLACCVARLLQPCDQGDHTADVALSNQVNWRKAFDPGRPVLERFKRDQLLAIAERVPAAYRMETAELRKLKKSELAGQVVEAFDKHRRHTGETPWLPAEVFGD